MDNAGVPESSLQQLTQKDESTTTIGLLNLPIEMLDMIFEKLPFEDIVKLRRVCRKLKDVFPSLCKNPVVFCHSKDWSREREDRGLARLRTIVKGVTSAVTRTLTIFQPPNCEWVMNIAMVKDIKKRCPFLKRLILKDPLDSDVQVRENTIRALPGSWELELHHASIENDNCDGEDNLHGIFKGPFNCWTVEFVRSHRYEEDFFQRLPGYPYDEEDSEEGSDEEDYNYEDEEYYDEDEYYGYGYDEMDEDDYF